ncbi:ATP-binding protein [Baekduia sp.]|jgi:DNA-binding CsgD family transcriptional regulator|uniref:ATP-binding protein n=1 Tax=Baekduia sp. TaxID=2600305 RepID=UPI002DFF1456|nr:AAA family ATPase [Baekduia sp.]
MPDPPGSLRLTSTFPFVGRSAELRKLRTLLPLAESEGGRVVLLGGEPGSGKSRLVGELASEAASDGVLVLTGACDAVVRTPYGPFVEALDQLARTIDPDELRTALGATGGELTRLLPDLPARIGELAAPVAADPDTERHRLHTTVATLLTAISRRRPVLLVLEDGHWADAPTLQLLRYLARAAGSARLLLLATFRDAEADVPGTLAETLADLRRSDTVVRMRVAGFSGEEVTEFIRCAAGGEVGAGPPWLAKAIGDLTGGNAFLVCELWRDLVETGMVELVDGTVRLTRATTDLGTPESVREVVSQRLARLADGTVELLELAATAGGEFGLDVVRRAAGVSDADLLERLDEAVRSGMIDELPSRTLTYRFAHELVRRALYDRLTGVRRAELHLRVGEALESAEARSGRALADLAHHFALAAPLGGAQRGVEYNVLAARAATGALAFDEAVARLRTALDLQIESPQGRAEVLIELGIANHRAGNALDALDALRDAAQIARELGDPDLLGRAAIGYEDACWRPGMADQGAVELLEEATAAVGEASSEIRIGLLSGLARALDFQGDHERAAIVRASAIGMAQRSGDRAGLATVLMRAYWSRGKNSLEEILAMLTEAAMIGEELGNTEIRTEAMSWQVPTLVALGEIEAARREVVVLLETAEHTAQPFMLHVAAHCGAAMALSDGRLEEAEALANRSHDWSRLLTGREASGVHGIQMFGIRREQGRLAELAPVIRLLAGQPGSSGPWRPGLVSVLVELGMDTAARQELEQVRTDGLDSLRESLWLASLTYLTDACAALGDEATAALVYPELEPLAGTNVMVGHLVACYGAADRYLGMLAATLGEWDRADEHFEHATALNRRTGMLTWLSHTLHQHARARIARGDAAGAVPLLSEAAAIAEASGQRALLARIRSIGPEPPATPEALPDGLSSREVEILRLVARGLSNREVGAALMISEHTAANHMRSILRKTGCANRTQAATYAHRHGLAEA